MREQEALRARIQQEIAEAQTRLQKDENDSYLSHVWAAEAETLRSLCRRLQEGESGAKMLAWLRQELPRLEKQMEEELEHPTFDWYDDHYHYKCMEGQRNAYRMIENLLAALPPR